MSLYGSLPIAFRPHGTPLRYYSSLSLYLSAASRALAEELTPATPQTLSISDNLHILLICNNTTNVSILRSTSTTNSASVRTTVRLNASKKVRCHRFSKI